MKLTTAPRLVIAGCGGDSGKTFATLGLLRAWRREGNDVQPFKKGPDYIDPAWLTKAAEKPARNLDSFLMGREGVLRSFTKHAIAEGLNVIEGNRGLYDGEDVEGSNSTAVLAKILQAPIVLILPVAKVTRTAAAFVLGMKMLDPDVQLAGVILNQVSGQRHERIIREAIEQIAGVPVLGAIPRLGETPFAGRHLGLVTPEEHQFADAAIDHAGDIITENVDLVQLKSLALKYAAWKHEFKCDDAGRSRDFGKLQIGVFTGSAFTFYYPENIEALTSAGAEIVPINPLTDTTIPEIDALYIGGGFPETHGASLNGNKAILTRIKELSVKGLPIWAECGGLMYLAESILWEGVRYEMAGVLPVSVEVFEKPQGHGYTEIVVDTPNGFIPVGTKLKGHEFHYSRLQGTPSLKTIFEVKRGVGIGNGRDGIKINNTIATYTHLHSYASPEWAAGLIKTAQKYRNEKSIIVQFE